MLGAYSLLDGLHVALLQFENSRTALKKTVQLLPVDLAPEQSWPLRRRKVPSFLFSSPPAAEGGLVHVAFWLAGM
jgi:hypothetical protein